jgi:parallel beta-helix repeat protein
MDIFGSSATGNVVQGNFIGTDVTGTVALANPVSAFGITNATDNLIGGTEPGAGNIIAGGSLGGLRIITQEVFGGSAADNIIQGNFIGTDLTGTIELGNGGHGIELANTSGNIIGGTASGAGNIIAHSGEDGVFVESGTNNTILGNTIHSNGSLGIDLGTDGVNSNDSGDGDTGANNLLNFPVLSAVTASNITGSLNSAPNTTFRTGRETGTSSPMVRGWARPRLRCGLNGQAGATVGSTRSLLWPRTARVGSVRAA